VVVHSVSAEITAHLRRLGVPEAKLVEIPVGVDTSLFSPAPDMPRSQALRLICPRKHEPVYDNMTVVEALGRLKAAGRTFECVIASEGSLLAVHKARVRELGLGDRVSFPGEVPHAKVPAMLREADIYISATLSDGTSSALLEAMAVG
jgi:glycosyltransferase involved in cell wall biosynthesis